MGVSGCGKSTLARALATALGWHFVEGDDCHPASNIAKMRAGIPLSDFDRWPFLDSVAATLSRHVDTGAVASCSALRLSYRDRIRAECDQVRFVLPAVTPEELKARMARRKGQGVVLGAGPTTFVFKLAGATQPMAAIADVRVRSRRAVMSRRSFQISAV
ncbi:gluconokinase [Paraburkholderia sp. UCT31]|uniref:gluconokinase n=1 Tax=Paraburkholderia sp. UCT31 TaxID=2615209 RepID=UPI0016554136|nr:gluconokinase [Paraburkholderia sp. UCT31]